MLGKKLNDYLHGQDRTIGNLLTDQFANNFDAGHWDSLFSGLRWRFWHILCVQFIYEFKDKFWRQLQDAR